MTTEAPITSTLRTRVPDEPTEPDLIATLPQGYDCYAIKEYESFNSNTKQNFK